MMKTWLPLTLAFAAIPAVAAPLNQHAALKVLAQTLHKNHGMDAECAGLELETTDSVWIQFAVREHHGGHCAGDPHTSPVVGHFRVQRLDRSIQKYDPANDRWSDEQP